MEKLNDLIKTKHNLNHKTQQTTLKGEIIKEDVWFTKLNFEQISSIEQFLDPKR